MTLRVLLAILAMVVCAGSSRSWAHPQAGTASKRPKPIQELSQHIDYEPPPSSIDEMTSMAAAVVLARYTEGKSTQDTPLSLVWTTHVFEIEEVVKADAKLTLLSDSRLEVTLPGGEVERPTDVVRVTTEGVGTLTRGNSYLIFLAVNRFTDKLILKWGPASVFDVTSPYVESLATNRREHSRKEAGAFLGGVRSAARR